MRVATTPREIDRISVVSEKKFSIRATGRAFKILSSSLYRDKIQAIVREISCNAYDGHVAAGCPDRPFTVHLPNVLEPFFSVRDEGTGLSCDVIESLYVTYFESTKADSNDYIGAMGLGCKSPFCYVGAFSVIARFNGVQTNYAAVIGDGDEPALIRMGQQPADAGNGIEVIVPVEPDDIPHFRIAAERVLSIFAVRPIITGCPDFAFIEPDVLMAGEGWQLCRRETPGARAIMGNVAYPISHSALKGVGGDALTILTARLDIRFPIGALDVTAGREDLSYDVATLAALTVRAEAIFRDARRVIKDEMAAAPSHWAAKAVLEHYCNGVMGIGRSLGVDTGGWYYHDRPVAAHAVELTIKHFPGVRLTHIVRTTPPPPRFTSSTRQYSPATPHATLRVAAAQVRHLIADNLPGNGAVSRTLAFLRDNPGVPSVLLIQALDSSALDHTSAGLRTLRKALDGIPLLWVSSLAKPLVKRAVAMPAVAVKRWQAPARPGFSAEDGWVAADLDPASGGWYVPRHGVYVAQRNNRGRDYNFSTIMAQATALKLIDAQQPIYGVDRKMQHKLVAQGGWVDVRDDIAAALTQELSRTGLGERLEAYTESHEVNVNFQVMARRVREYRFTETVKRLPPEHPLARWASEYEQVAREAADPEMRSLYALTDALGLLKPRQHPERLIDQLRAIETSHPLFKVVTHGHEMRIDPVHLAAYLQIAGVYS